MIFKFATKSFHIVEKYNIKFNFEARFRLNSNILKSVKNRPLCSIMVYSGEEMQY